MPVRWKILSLLLGAFVYIRAGCERPHPYAQDETGEVQLDDADTIIEDPVQTYQHHAQSHRPSLDNEHDDDLGGMLPTEVRHHTPLARKEMWSEVDEAYVAKHALLEIGRDPEKDPKLSYGHMDTLHDGKYEGPDGFVKNASIDVSRNYTGALETLTGEHWKNVQDTMKDATNNASDYKSKLKSLAFQMSGGQANMREAGRAVSKGHENWTRYHNITVPLNYSQYYEQWDKGHLKFPPDQFDLNHTNFDALKVPSGGENPPSNPSPKKKTNGDPDDLSDPDKPNNGGGNGGQLGGGDKTKPETCADFFGRGDSCEIEEQKKDPTTACDEGCIEDKCCDEDIKKCSDEVDADKCSAADKGAPLPEAVCTKPLCDADHCCAEKDPPKQEPVTVDVDGVNGNVNLQVTTEEEKENVKAISLKGIGGDSALLFQLNKGDLVNGDAPFKGIWDQKVGPFLEKWSAPDGWTPKICTTVGTTLGGNQDGAVGGCRQDTKGVYTHAMGQKCLLKMREEKMHSLIKQVDGGSHGNLAISDHAAHVFSDVYASVVVLAYKQGHEAEAICQKCKCTRPTLPPGVQLVDKCNGKWSCCKELECLGKFKKDKDTPFGENPQIQ